MFHNFRAIADGGLRRRPTESHAVQRSYRRSFRPCPRRAIYDLGHSTIFAARSDPRFSYCMYVPPHIDSARHPVELVVVMHGTGRAFVEYRDAFAEFARWNDCIVLCPLFPVGVLGDGNRDGFKQLHEGEIRYDRAAGHGGRGRRSSAGASSASACSAIRAAASS